MRVGDEKRLYSRSAKKEPLAQSAMVNGTPHLHIDFDALMDADAPPSSRRRSRRCPISANATDSWEVVFARLAISSRHPGFRYRPHVERHAALEVSTRP